MNLISELPENINITVTKQDLIDLVINCLSRINNLQEKHYPEHLSIKQLAEYLSYSEAAIYKMVAQAVIPYYKLGGKLLFRRKEIDAWLFEYRKPNIKTQIAELDSKVN